MSGRKLRTGTRSTPAALPLLLARVPLEWASIGGAMVCAILIVAAQDRLSTFASAFHL